MDEQKRIRQTVDLTAEDWESVREVAAAFGLLNERGPKAGKGSHQHLLQAIADRRLRVILASPEKS